MPQPASSPAVMTPFSRLDLPAQRTAAASDATGFAALFAAASEGSAGPELSAAGAPLAAAESEVAAAASAWRELHLQAAENTGQPSAPPPVAAPLAPLDAPQFLSIALESGTGDEASNDTAAATMTAAAVDPSAAIAAPGFGANIAAGSEGSPVRSAKSSIASSLAGGAELVAATRPNARAEISATTNTPVAPPSTGSAPADVAAAAAAVRGDAPAPEKNAVSPSSAPAPERVFADLERASLRAKQSAAHAAVAGAKAVAPASAKADMNATIFAGGVLNEEAVAAPIITRPARSESPVQAVPPVESAVETRIEARATTHPPGAPASETVAGIGAHQQHHASAAGAEPLSRPESSAVMSQSAAGALPIGIAAQVAVDSVATTQPSSSQHTTAAALPVEGIAVEIAARAKEGKRRFEIRLDPPELGRIDVRLDVSRDGQVTSRLVVERAETLDLLRRDSASLERALQSAGLRTDDGSLQFSLRDQNAGSWAGRDDRPSSSVLIVPDEDVAVHDAVRRAYGVLRGLGRGVDIRI